MAQLFTKDLNLKLIFLNIVYFHLLIDLSELDEIDKNIKFFSFNKFNLISFFEKDHGDRDGSSLISWVKKNLNENKIELKRYKNKTFMLSKNFWICF